MILEAVRQGLASTRIGARIIKSRPFKERPGVQPLIETVATCRRISKDKYPIIEGLEEPKLQLCVTDPKANKKYFVFKIFFCDGRRYHDKSHREFPGTLVVSQAVPSLLAKKSEHCENHPGKDQKPKRDISDADSAIVKSIMKKYDVFEAKQNAGISWGYDDDNLPMIQTYLLVNAEKRDEANNKLTQLLEELTTCELNEREVRPLFIIKPTFEWTAASEGPVPINRWSLSHSD